MIIVDGHTLSPGMLLPPCMTSSMPGQLLPLQAACIFAATSAALTEIMAAAAVQKQGAPAGSTARQVGVAIAAI